MSSESSRTPKVSSELGRLLMSVKIKKQHKLIWTNCKKEGPRKMYFLTSHLTISLLLTSRKDWASIQEFWRQTMSKTSPAKIVCTTVWVLAKAMAFTLSINTTSIREAKGIKRALMFKNCPKNRTVHTNDDFIFSYYIQC